MNLSTRADKYLFTLLMAAGVCLLAWIISVHHLDLDSMWDDEHFTWRIIQEDPLYVITETAQDVHPPIHYLWVWLWRFWMGGSDNLFVLRLSSAITSVLTVAVTYRLGRDWFRNRWIGWDAALFMATSGVFVYYARDLRMYSLITLLAALSWWMLWRLTHDKRGGLWGYALSVVLMAYTFYLAGFMVVAQFLVVIFFHRRHLRRLLLALGIAFIAFMPWLPTFINQLEETSAQRGVDSGVIGPMATEDTTLQTIEKFISIYTADRLSFMLLLTALAVMGSLSSKYPKTYRPWVIAAALWFGFTIVFIFAVNVVVPVYGPRYVITILPGMALLVGVAIFQMRSFWTRAAALIIITLSGLLTHDAVFANLPIKAPHRDLLQTVAMRFQPGDKIWYNLSGGALGSSIDLSSAYHLEYDTPQLSTDDFVWDAPSDYMDAETTPRVWDVRPYWITMPEEAETTLTAERSVIEEYTLGAYTVRLYTAPPVDQPVYTFGELFEVVVAGGLPDVYAAGETLQVNSWWRALQNSPLDYSFGLYLFDGETTITQVDGALSIDDQGTSEWPTSEKFAPLNLTFDLPQDLPPGVYNLLLGVYYWENPERLPVFGELQEAINTELSLLDIATVQVE